ncbi:MAG: hypothetical protein HY275_18970 [Gemmatimonadetes bacterium]|nr:hypothetical protein [Gemmatimonadota bacterium]
MSVSVVDAGLARAHDAPRGWISTPAFDLSCFVFAPVAGLAFLAAALLVPSGYGFLVQSAAFYFVAVPHYMSTYTFFMGDANRRHYRTRRLAFLAGPLGIAVAVTQLWVLRFPPAIQVTVFVWNVWHVARQNNGILAIYRRLHGGDRREFAPANVTLLGFAVAMSFWHIDRFAPVGDVLARLHPDFGRACAIAGLAAGLVGLVILAGRLRAPGRHPAWQELAFLASSIAMFHPYLWVADYTVATLGMLMGHFVQYLALVWLLHRRTYEAGVPVASAPERVLGAVATRLTLVLIAFVICGAFFLIANRATAALGVPSVYTVSWFAFTFIHFYLDGFLWAFRDPHVRDTVGRVLMPPERIAA